MIKVIFRDEILEREDAEDFLNYWHGAYTVEEAGLACKDYFLEYGELYKVNNEEYIIVKED